jgi:hypothetical protein
MFYMEKYITSATDLAVQPPHWNHLPAEIAYNILEVFGDSREAGDDPEER